MKIMLIMVSWAAAHSMLRIIMLIMVRARQIMLIYGKLGSSSSAQHAQDNHARLGKLGSSSSAQHAQDNHARHGKLGKSCSSW
jgi:predicted lipid-binding transport protein (Tim44 family)